jgi:hypothetical protein
MSAFPFHFFLIPFAFLHLPSLCMQVEAPADDGGQPPAEREKAKSPGRARREGVLGDDRDRQIDENLE